jgi:squalene cyclase
LRSVLPSTPESHERAVSAGLVQPSEREASEIALGKRIDQIIQFVAETYPEKYREAVLSVLLDQITVRQELLNEMSQWQEAKTKEKAK